MSNEQQSAIFKVNLSDPPNKLAIVYTKWQSENIYFDLILLSDGDSVHAAPKQFFGVLSVKQVREIASRNEEDFDQFFAETKQLLCGKYYDEYTFELEESPLCFVWRKKFTETIKVVCGRVELNTSDAKNVTDVILSLIDIKSSLEIRNELLHAENQRWKTHCERITDEYEMYVDKQEKREHELMTKFLALLNEKKRKIADLEGMIEKFEIESQIEKKAGPIAPTDSDETQMQATPTIENVFEAETQLYEHWSSDKQSSQESTFEFVRAKKKKRESNQNAFPSTSQYY